MARVSGCGSEEPSQYPSSGELSGPEFSGSPVGVHRYWDFMMSMTTMGLEDRAP